MGCVESADIATINNTLKPVQKQTYRDLEYNYKLDVKFDEQRQKIIGKEIPDRFHAFSKHQPEYMGYKIQVLDKNDDEMVEVLTVLDHPNIVKSYEAYSDEYYMQTYLVMESTSGERLSRRIDTTFEVNRNLGYNFIYITIKQLLKAAQHMHSLGVVHTNINPSDILYSIEGGSGYEIPFIKLTGFGKSTRKKGKKKFFQMIGDQLQDFGYRAPELLRSDNYDSKCDIWSIGCLLYKMCTGRMPFTSKDQILDQNRYIYHQNFEDDYTLQDLLNKLLEFNPKKRLSAQDALEHWWFEKSEQEKEDKERINILCDYYKNPHIQALQEYKCGTVLKRAVMNLLVKIDDRSNLGQVKLLFQKINESGSGIITADELKECIIDPKKDEIVKNVITQCSYQIPGKLCYTEFLIATMVNIDSFLNGKDDTIKTVYSMFDTDRSGAITRDNLITGMSKIGHEITLAELDEIMTQNDLEKNGVIEFAAFRAVLYGIDDVNDERYQAMKAQFPQELFTNFRKN